MSTARTYEPSEYTPSPAVKHELGISARSAGTTGKRSVSGATVLRDLSGNGKRSAASNIALVYTGEPSIGCGFDAAIMCGMSRGMQDHGYDLLVLGARRSRLPGESLAGLFARKGVCGVVVRTTAGTKQVCAEIAETGLPTVVVADRVDLPNVSSIYSDSREESGEAVDHLIALGHRRIAICMNVVDDCDHADRYAAYRQSLANAGIEFDPRLVM